MYSSPVVEFQVYYVILIHGDIIGPRAKIRGCHMTSTHISSRCVALFSGVIHIFLSQCSGVPLATLLTFNRLKVCTSSQKCFHTALRNLRKKFFASLLLHEDEVGTSLCIMGVYCQNCLY